MLPKFVKINELAPREGVQNAINPISTADKVRLIDALSECNFKMIEVTSFVNPQKVPQVADAHEVAQQIHRRAGTLYTAAVLNRNGIKRAFDAGLDPESVFLAHTSETFARKNQNRSCQEILDDLPAAIGLWREFGHNLDVLAVATAFGCNYEGDTPSARVIETMARAIAMAADHGNRFKTVLLGDTVGWATPLTTRRLVSEVREHWPELRIKLHLHDTHGLGLANAFTGLELGVDEFDASVGGVGGCPFAGSRASVVAGNIVTEDLVNLCHECGIETGIDQERLLDVARLAEGIFGHRLAGKNMYAGSVTSYRRVAQAAR